MSLREQFEQLRPGRIFLDPGDLSGIAAWLKRRGWIRPQQKVIAATRAGEGNMNCTLRIETTEGTFILKQARPWVEKYPAISAPDERAIIEAAFYEAVAVHPLVSSRMPRLLAAAPEECVLMLEDLGSASDFTSIYSAGAVADEEVRLLSEWLHALHTGFSHQRLAPRFTNAALRKLNHLHIFDLPLQRGNELPLDQWTPGLAGQASILQNDERYCRRVAELGQLYLGPGECLIHGDFFPGSWLRARHSTWIIDPEFCFWGVAEFDAGVMIAHLLLARAPAETLEAVYTACRLSNPALARAFAGVEIMRRLIGVAQLPLPYDLAGKARLLEQSRELVAGL